mgnify:CR=1 FL=1
MSLNDFITALAKEDDNYGSTSGFFSTVNTFGHAGNNCFDLLDTTLAQDSLFQTLLKDYTQSQSRLNAIISEHGADSPMAELATEMRDMARASVETRLLELRHSHPEFFERTTEIQESNSGVSLETSPRLRKRKEMEEKQKRDREAAEREANASIANDTFLAFLLLSLFSSRFQRTGQLVPFIDMGTSFRNVSGREGE